MTNVARHAHTQETQVLMVFNEELIELQISDQGVGFNPDLLTTFPNRLGLTGMKERVESVGGKLEIWSMPQRGTTVKMSISTQVALSKNNVTSP